MALHGLIKERREGRRARRPMMIISACIALSGGVIVVGEREGGVDRVVKAEA